MTNTYTWNFPAFDTYSSYEGKSTVVYNIHWTLTGSNNASPTPHTSTVIGVEPITYDSSAPFTDFSSLTKDKVESWIVAKLGEERVASLKSSLDKSIAEQIAPTTSILKAPWENSNTPTV
jgi:hypothetical protein